MRLIRWFRALSPSTLTTLVLLGFLAVVPLPIAGAASAASKTPVPKAVKAKAGPAGTIAVIRWQAADGVNSYRVWRSTRSLAGFEPVGSTATTSFSDTSGVPGRTYYYQVTALLPSGDESDASTPTAGVVADWNQSPHATYGKGNLCLTCHAQHRGDPEDAPGAGEVAICMSCHDGQGATTDVKDGPRDSFALASGHRVEEAKRSPDLTNECSSCHSPHADPRKRPGLYPKRIGKTGVSAGNTWCAACHDDTSAWSPRYPAAGAPTRDAAGYPVLGTYPGPSAYALTSRGGHAGISGTSGGPKGDCLLCHAAHRGPNRYDGLLLEFRPSSASSVASDQAEGTYAQLCLNCHDGTQTWAKQGAADIARYVTRRGVAGYAGHSIVTSGGTLPVGAPIPCYDCHNPHGSSRGNTSMISDALGRGLGTRDTGGVRAFCLTCHTTSDGWVWNSVRRRNAKVDDATIEGLRRDGSDRSVLRLPEGTDGHLAASAASCYGCHGSDYGDAAGFNVHAPRPKGSRAEAVTPAGTKPTQEKTPTVPPFPAQ